jgi:hypothetical protein
MTSQILFFFHVLESSTIHNTESVLNVTGAVVESTNGMFNIIFFLGLVILTGLVLSLPTVPESSLLKPMHEQEVTSSKEKDSNPPRNIDLFFSHIPALAPAVVFDRNDPTGMSLAALFAFKQYTFVTHNGMQGIRISSRANFVLHHSDPTMY